MFGFTVVVPFPTIIFFQLGSGSFSTVKLATSKETGKQYAVKIVNRSSMTGICEQELLREMEILNELNHENVLCLVETYSTTENHYLVTDLLVGGELFDRIGMCLSIYSIYHTYSN